MENKNPIKIEKLKGEFVVRFPRKFATFDLFNKVVNAFGKNKAKRLDLSLEDDGYFRLKSSKYTTAWSVRQLIAEYMLEEYKNNHQHL